MKVDNRPFYCSAYSDLEFVIIDSMTIGLRGSSTQNGLAGNSESTAPDLTLVDSERPPSFCRTAVSNVHSSPDGARHRVPFDGEVVEPNPACSDPEGPRSQRVTATWKPFRKYGTYMQPLTLCLPSRREPTMY